jgi:XRE family transcriptional regulator, aerobic/anaerobic benzoate catabolism transcriptional regulator
MTLLQRVASRVRGLREARSMSRLDLSERSGLSVRFLAQIEAGAGNVSLLRLARLAEALGTTPEALLRAPLARAEVIALVGMRGAGKSTIGPRLAARLERPFLEMDALIQDAAGLPLDQIFELHGERHYRRLERETLQRILEREGEAVVAAAGGVVNEPTTWRLLLERTTVVWLRARPEDHWSRVVEQGDRRPMADHPDAMAELRATLAARESRYAQAHVVIDTSGRSPEELVERIAEELSATEPAAP